MIAPDWFDLVGNIMFIGWKGFYIEAINKRWEMPRWVMPQHLTEQCPKFLVKISQIPGRKYSNMKLTQQLTQCKIHIISTGFHKVFPCIRFEGHSNPIFLLSFICYNKLHIMFRDYRNILVWRVLWLRRGPISGNWWKHPNFIK